MPLAVVVEAALLYEPVESEQGLKVEDYQTHNLDGATPTANNQLRRPGHIPSVEQLVRDIACGAV
jgi:hypothetical protein